MWGRIRKLNAIALSNNSLTGTIPREMLQVPTLVYFSVGLNQLSGTIPPVTSSLLFLIVQGNAQLRGTIPSTFSYLGAAAMCGTAVQCRGIGATTYCFPGGAMPFAAGMSLPKVLQQLPGYAVPCLTPQPGALTSTHTLNAVDVPKGSLQPPAALTVSTRAWSGAVCTVVVAQAVFGTASGALAAGAHGMQSAIVMRRKRRLCELNNASQSADDGSSGTLSQDADAMCCRRSQASRR
jgi:hypothetical protein